MTGMRIWSPADSALRLSLGHHELGAWTLHSRFAFPGVRVCPLRKRSTTIESTGADSQLLLGVNDTYAAAQMRLDSVNSTVRLARPASSLPG